MQPPNHLKPNMPTPQQMPPQFQQAPQTMPQMGQQQFIQQATTPVETVVSQLAMQVFARAAANFLQDCPLNLDANKARIRQIANDSVQAARDYFIALGALKEDPDSD